MLYKVENAASTQRNKIKIGNEIDGWDPTIKVGLDQLGISPYDMEKKAGNAPTKSYPY